MRFKDFIKKANNHVFNDIKRTGIFDKMDDKTYIDMLYKRVFHRKVNWDNPQTFNEKIQWLKLYDRRPEYTTMVDKYEAKKYVAERIGDEYIIPTLGVWDKFEEIDFNSLPNQFVLKCTHDSGGLVICKDKSALDMKKAKKKINRSLKRNYYYSGREWAYKDVKPRIIAEKYMVDESGYELKDYKFLCFNGIPKVMYVGSDRNNIKEEVKFDFFDMYFTHLAVRNGHPNSNKTIKCPPSFEKMKELASILAAGTLQIRIDFYDINGKIYFGEITTAHNSGLLPFTPIEWDKQFGGWIILPR